MGKKKKHSKSKKKSVKRLESIDSIINYIEEDNEFKESRRVLAIERFMKPSEEDSFENLGALRLGNRSVFMDFPESEADIVKVSKKHNLLGRKSNIVKTRQHIMDILVEKFDLKNADEISNIDGKVLRKALQEISSEVIAKIKNEMFSFDNIVIQSDEFDDVKTRNGSYEVQLKIGPGYIILLARMFGVIMSAEVLMFGENGSKNNIFVSLTNNYEDILEANRAILSNHELVLIQKYLESLWGKEMDLPLSFISYFSVIPLAVQGFFNTAAEMRRRYNKKYNETHPKGEKTSPTVKREPTEEDRHNVIRRKYLALNEIGVNLKLRHGGIRSTRKKMRYHKVSGFWRTYKSGKKVWIHPFERGQKSEETKPLRKEIIIK